jgi:hypothetical protein
VFENRRLRRKFEPKRDELRREWRKLNDDELNDLYSPHIIVRMITSRRMRWAGHAARMGKRRVVYRILVWKHVGNRPHGRHRRRWDDNIQDVGCMVIDWIELAQDRDRWREHINLVTNLRVP